MSKRKIDAPSAEEVCSKRVNSGAVGEGHEATRLRSLQNLRGLLEIDGLSSRMLEYLVDADLLQLRMTCKRSHASVMAHALRTKVFLMSTIQGWEEAKRALVRKLKVDTESLSVRIREMQLSV